MTSPWVRSMRGMRQSCLPTIPTLTHSFTFKLLRVLHWAGRVPARVRYLSESPGALMACAWGCGVSGAGPHWLCAGGATVLYHMHERPLRGCVTGVWQIQERRVL